MTALTLKTLEDTQALAQRLGALLEVGDVILLKGLVGAGKTELTRCVIQHLLPPHLKDEAIPSPTFTLVQTYETTPPIWHLDLYRLKNPEEVWELGLEEGLTQAVLFIEWPENMGDLKFQNTLTLTLSLDDDQKTRHLDLSGTGTWQNPLNRLA